MAPKYIHCIPSPATVGQAQVVECAESAAGASTDFSGVVKRAGFAMRRVVPAGVSSMLCQDTNRYDMLRIV